jgi:hypothetical protein
VAESVGARRVTVVLGATLLGWGGGGTALLLTAHSSAQAVTAPGLTGLDNIVATAASGAGAVLLSWLAASLVASVLELRRVDRWGGRVDATPAAIHSMPAGPTRARVGFPRLHPPRSVRRLAALMLGLTLVTGTAGAAHAAPAVTTPAVTSPAATSPAVTSPAATTPAVTSASATSPDGLGPTATWTPDRPAVSAARAVLPDVGLVTAAPRLGAVVSEEVAVRRGDSLWSIAARHLGPDARADEVARTWPLWWRANRGVIGANPDLIHPGQILRAPTAASG